MSRVISLFALMMVLLVSACGQATKGDSQAAAGGTAQTITHAQGSTELKGTPQRIAVLDMGALDSLRALGLNDKVVAVPKQNLGPLFAEYADAKYADAGTLFEPNLENLNKANPDLVVVGFRSAKQYPELSKHWPTIDVTYPGELDFVEGTSRVAGTLGQIFGKSAEVDRRVAELKTKLEALKPEATGAGRGLIVMTSAGKVTLQGPSSRFGIVHTKLDIPTAVENIGQESHGQAATFETIAQANPDTLFVVDRDAAVGQQGQNAMQVLDNELVRNTSAWQKQQIVQLDGYRWYILMYGLDNAAAMLDELATGLKK